MLWKSCKLVVVDALKIDAVHKCRCFVKLKSVWPMQPVQAELQVFSQGGTGSQSLFAGNAEEMQRTNDA